MKIILFDISLEKRIGFWPIAMSRPIWELRCGMTTLGQKLVSAIGPGASDVATFVPPYMAAAYAQGSEWPVNDLASLRGNDLLLLNARLKADSLELDATGPSEVALGENEEVLYARIRRKDLAALDMSSIEAFLASAATKLPISSARPATWKYIWELVLANPAMISSDFAFAGRCGLEGKVEEPLAIRGDRTNVYIAPGALVHPMVVIDAERGPVYIDEGAEIHPFTRIEGPCYVGKKSILLGAKCREGNTIGPMCRIGGEVEESIIQGYSNKYHDGFLGHAYVGEWVNLGAMTANSDLRNDYGPVSVVIEGGTSISTGSNKVGCLIGDHTKTSIGTLFNTGAYVGAMTLLVAHGGLLPKCIPSFCSFLTGKVTNYFGRDRLYLTAAAAMKRRGKLWTDADASLWQAVFEMTAHGRGIAVARK